MLNASFLITRCLELRRSHADEPGVVAGGNEPNLDRRGISISQNGDGRQRRAVGLNTEPGDTHVPLVRGRSRFQE